MPETNGSQTGVAISRRDCVKLMGGLALAFGAGGVLSACSGQTAEQGGTEQGGGERVLRVGIAGGSTDTIDPSMANGAMLPFAVYLNIFDSLVLMEGEEMTYQLADEITTNDDGTEWTIVIKEGVTFHNGDPLTADDVLYSLQYLSTSPNGMMGYMYVDWDSSVSDGDRTVTIRLTQPQATFVEEALAPISTIFPNGTTADQFDVEDLGSGPYKLVSFDPDSGTVIEAFEGYWGGAPEIDRIELFPMMESSSRVTALTGGQIDFAHQISSTDVATIEGAEGLAVMSGGVAHSSVYKFCLNATKAPFDDEEVRTAFKAIVDREAMVETIFRGEGEVGNDVIGKGLPGYNDAIEQRSLDFESAAQVFRVKDITSLDVLTSELVPGIKDSVDMLAQQMEKAGVALNVTEVDPANIFTDMQPIYDTQVFATYLINRPYAARAYMDTGATSPYNFSQWADEEYNALLTQASQTGGEAERTEIYDQAQQILWERGSEVMWGYAYELSAHIEGVSGVGITQSVPLFAKASMA